MPSSSRGREASSDGRGERGTNYGSSHTNGVRVMSPNQARAECNDPQIKQGVGFFHGPGRRKVKEGICETYPMRHEARPAPESSSSGSTLLCTMQLPRPHLLGPRTCSHPRALWHAASGAVCRALSGHFVREVKFEANPGT